jgi:hypothetical protein
MRPGEKCKAAARSEAHHTPAAGLRVCGPLRWAWLWIGMCSFHQRRVGGLRRAGMRRGTPVWTLSLRQMHQPHRRQPQDGSLGDQFSVGPRHSARMRSCNLVFVWLEAVGRDAGLERLLNKAAEVCVRLFFCCPPTVESRELTLRCRWYGYALATRIPTRTCGSLSTGVKAVCPSGLSWATIGPEKKKLC